MAANKQIKAANQAQGAITDSYNKAQTYQQPYFNAGQQGLAQMQAGDYGVNAPGVYQSGEQQPQYTADQFNFQQDPGYQFQLQQGQDAALGSAAGRGAGLSGSTLKALAKYGTGLANQSYGDSFNRYMQGRQQNLGEYQTNLGQFNQNRNFGAGQQQQNYENLNQQSNQRYGRALNLGQMGQTAAGNLANMATDYGSNLAGLYGQRGNAEASGVMGIAQGVGQLGQGLGQATSLGNLMANNLAVAKAK
jgi:hypothetical protein